MKLLDVSTKPFQNGIKSRTNHSITKIMTEHAIVKRGLIEILRKKGYTSCKSLTQRDYDHVSVEIQEGTGVSISSITIKRLLHGQFSRVPQIATLDAISKYLGFKGWQEFKLERQRQQEWLNEQPSIIAVELKPIATNRSNFLLISGVLALASGLAMLLVPSLIIRSMGISYASSEAALRGTSGLIIGFGLINFFARNFTEEHILKTIFISNIVAHLTAIVSNTWNIIDSSSATITILLVWTIHLFIVAGSVLYLFMPKGKQMDRR